MTLVETVIAIGVIAVAVPLIMAVSSASLNDKRNAEADTKSAWLARDLQDQVAALWATPRGHSYLPDTLSLPFPTIGTAAEPTVFLYDNDAKFIAVGASTDMQTGSKQDKAQYLVSLYSTSQPPSNLTTSTTKLARLFIKVEYPAKASLKKRQVNQYSVVSTIQHPL